MWYFLFFIFIKTRVNSPPTIGNGYLYFVYVLDLLVHTFFLNYLTFQSFDPERTRFYDNSRGMFCLVYGVNATFKNISVISILLMKETGVPGENHRPVASPNQPLINLFFIFQI
jgi:hypothetical protein